MHPMEVTQIFQPEVDEDQQSPSGRPAKGHTPPRSSHGSMAWATLPSQNLGNSLASALRSSIDADNARLKRTGQSPAFLRSDLPENGDRCVPKSATSVTHSWGQRSRRSPTRRYKEGPSTETANATLWGTSLAPTEPPSTLSASAFVDVLENILIKSAVLDRKLKGKDGTNPPQHRELSVEPPQLAAPLPSSPPHCRVNGSPAGVKTIRPVSVNSSGRVVGIDEDGCEWVKMNCLWRNDVHVDSCDVTVLAKAVASVLSGGTEKTRAQERPPPPPSPPQPLDSASVVGLGRSLLQAVHVESPQNIGSGGRTHQSTGPSLSQKGGKLGLVRSASPSTDLSPQSSAMSPSPERRLGSDYDRALVSLYNRRSRSIAYEGGVALFSMPLSGANPR
jgi:hypothetical protein